jgi:hypothetical protein
MPSGLCLKSSLEYLNVLNSSLKMWHSLLTWVFGLGKGVSSCDPYRTRKSCYQGETKGGGTRGRLCPSDVLLK